MANLDHAFALTDGRSARVRFTTAADGDLAVGRPGPDLDRRRRTILPLSWTWLRQVHGARVVWVDRPGASAGMCADAAVTAVEDAPLVIHAADCAPVALVADEGIIGAVHVGWRGLVADVLAHTVGEMRSHGARTMRAVVGPCIHPCCYEFGQADLDLVADRYGDAVRAETTADRPALDIPAAVAVALSQADVVLGDDEAPCTACGGGFFSHRARGETARQAMLVWIESK